LVQYLNEKEKLGIHLIELDKEKKWLYTRFIII
jgi:hypothetical protein